MKKYLIFLFLLLITLTDAKVSLYQCIDKALQNSFDIKIQSKELEKQKLFCANATLEFLPSFVLSKNITKEIYEYKNTSNSIAISTRLNIFDERYFNYKLTSISLKQSQLDLKNERDNTILNVIETYMNINLLKEKLSYYKNLIINYKTQKEFIEKLVKAGSKTLFDLYSIEIEINNYELEAKQIENELENSIMQLNYLTGLSIKDPDELQPFDNNTLSTFLYKSEFEKSYEILLSNLSLKNARTNKLLAFTNLFPSIYLQGTASYAQTDDNILWGYKKNWQKSWELSLNFQYDIASLFGSVNNLSIAKINVYQQKLRLQKTISQKKLEIDTQKKNIALIKKQIEYDKKKFELAKLKFELAKKQFQSGLLDFFRFRDSANELLSTKIKLITDKKNYMLNLVKYQKAMGMKILNRY